MLGKKIAQDAIVKLNERITNEIFLIIQNDKELMKKYLRIIEKYALDLVNQSIGKEIKNYYKLINHTQINLYYMLFQSHEQ